MGKTSQRKIEQLRICVEEDVERRVHRSIDDVILIHNALPEIYEEDIDMRVNFLGFSFRYPLMIASMTGGHPETKVINRILASAAERMGIGIGVGSQRAALEDARNEDSFSVVRDYAPHAFVYANIGVVQIRDLGVEVAERVVEMVDADALAVHLNFLQEAVQPEGELDGRGCLAVIREVCESLKKPVIVKETGGGISYEVARKLHNAGVHAIDVGGNDGTNLVIAEMCRAEGDRMLEKLGSTFMDWGISTIESILECKNMPVKIIATGGIRSGLDIAKCIAVGADICSAAQPFLKAIFDSADTHPHDTSDMRDMVRDGDMSGRDMSERDMRVSDINTIAEGAGKRSERRIDMSALKSEEIIEEAVDRVCERVREIVMQLKIAMFLTGCTTVEHLKRAEFVIIGRTREIAEQRGFR